MERPTRTTPRRPERSYAPTKPASDVQIYSSIAEGRSAGMPAWGGKLPEDQIWMIIAYLRTLGTPREPEKPPTPSRTVASQ